MASLRDRTISGVFWSFLQQIGSKGVSLIATILLARILSPEDFGLIGMLVVFIEVSQTLINGGFSQALIQKRNVDEEDYSSVFYINLAVSILLYGILFVSAPLIAEFYKQPILIPMTRVLTLVFIINAFSYVQQARLAKAMRFKTLMFIHIPSTVISAIVAIVMALLGYGVWSMVMQQIIMRLAYTIQIWIYSKWKPLSTFNRQKARGLFSFGSRLMVSGVINSVYNNIYLIVIGKFFAVNTLGYYQNAKKLVDTPTTTLARVIKSVSFSAFSSVQEDNKALKQGYRRIIQQLLFWICPVLVLAAVLARPLFSFVLTDKWLPAVPFFQLICLWGILYPLNSFNIEIVNVKGRSDLTLKLQIIKKIIVTIGVFATIPFGIWALVIFQVVNGGIAYVINSYYSGQFIGYPIQEQILDILPIVLLSIVVGGIIFILNREVITFPEWLRVLLGFAIGMSLYGFVAWKRKFTPFEDFISIISEKFNLVAGGCPNGIIRKFITKRSRYE